MNASSTLEEIARTCGDGFPMPPGNDDETVFGAPWQAQVFAMTVSLHERGTFSWGEWAESLSARIKKAQAAGDTDDGTTYYERWAEALEDMIVATSLGSSSELTDLQTRWREAAARTPHGTPITLES